MKSAKRIIRIISRRRIGVRSQLKTHLECCLVASSDQLLPVSALHIETGYFHLVATHVVILFNLLLRPHLVNMWVNQIRVINSFFRVISWQQTLKSRFLNYLVLNILILFRFRSIVQLLSEQIFPQFPCFGIVASSWFDLLLSIREVALNPCVKV
jgi:hypothetical protein